MRVINLDDVERYGMLCRECGTEYVFSRRDMKFIGEGRVLRINCPCCYLEENFTTSDICMGSLSTENKISLELNYDVIINRKENE